MSMIIISCIVATSKYLATKYLTILNRKYRITRYDDLLQYLNMQNNCDCVLKTVFLCQEDYIDEMFKSFGFTINDAITTPTMDDKLKVYVSEEEIPTVNRCNTLQMS